MGKILYRRTLLLGLAALSLVLAGCGATKLTSQWRDREIVIDGDDVDWYDAKIHIDKTLVDIGIINDGDYLYVCLISADRSTQMQIARTGFTLWFDPGGGKSKKLGVRFPRGMRGQEAWAGVRNMRRGQGPDPGQLKTMFDQLLLQGEMEILETKKKERRRLEVGRRSGPDVRAVYDRGRLVYELRMPLVQGDFAIGVESGATVGVGFTTPELSSRGQGGNLGGLAGGGFGGRGGGRGGRRGGGGRGGNPDPLEIWTKVELAPGPGR